MKRQFSFMSGEWKVSMPAVFSMNNWQHTSTAERLIVKNNQVFRQHQPNDPLLGVILYADIENKDIELNNINIVIEHKLPCWPNPHSLLNMIDRFVVLKECAEQEFLNHEIVLGSNHSSDPDSQAVLMEQIPMVIPYPFVLKMGNVHRGEGKYLIKSQSDFPEMSGKFSIEPYFEGESVRALIIGDEIFGIRVTNEETWIKNAAGAEVHEYELSSELIEHARKVAKYFDIDLAGIDYIVEKNGDFHLLEINQYPGISGFDNVMESAKRFFKQKMYEIEKNA